MSNIKEQKEKYLDNEIKWAYIKDCGSGSGTYHSSAFYEKGGRLAEDIQKALNDDNVSFEDFKNILPKS